MADSLPAAVGRVYAAIVAVAVAERRGATPNDVRAHVEVGRTLLGQALAALCADARVFRVRTYGHATGPDIKPRYVYVPTAPLLGGGLCRCATPGCDRAPVLEVAGHALCRACSRGPVDRVAGGGQFRAVGSEAATARELAAARSSSVACAGGWEPADGEQPPRPPAPYVPEKK